VRTFSSPTHSTGYLQTSKLFHAVNMWGVKSECAAGYSDKSLPGGFPWGAIIPARGNKGDLIFAVDDVGHEEFDEPPVHLPASMRHYRGDADSVICGRSTDVAVGV
jgi:hypothetical protein